MLKSYMRKRRAKKEMERKFRADSPETKRVQQMLGVTEEQEKQVSEQLPKD